MRLTTKGRYAVTAMLDLALHSQHGPVCLADVAVRQGISLSYLEQLFARLRRADLVRSVRGPGGGYRLARNIDSVSIADIVTAVSETIDATRCGSKNNCQDGEVCLTHALWTGLSDHIAQYLQAITLQMLVDDNDVQTIAERQGKISLKRMDPGLALTPEH